MSRASLCVVSALVVISSLTAPVTAAEEKNSPSSLPVLTLRTGEHPSFDRVVFDAPKGVSHKVVQNGSAVTVEFNSAAKLSIPNKKDLPRVKGFEVVSGGDGTAPLVVRFSIDPKTSIKSFMSGSSIVMDVTGKAVPDVKTASENTPQPAKEAPKPAAPTPEQAKPAQEPPASQAKPAQLQITPTPLPPREQTKEAVPAPAAADAPIVPATRQQPAPNTFDAQLKAAPTNKPVSSIAPTPNAAPVVPIATGETSLPKEAAPFVSPTIRLDPQVVKKVRDILHEKEPLPVAVFDPRVQIGAAVFARGGAVTIIFDRKMAGNALITSPPPRLDLEPISLPNNTGFRIIVPDGVGVRATRKDTAWEIYLVPANSPPPLSTEFVSQPDFALGARLMIPTAAPPQAVYYPDPVVGDDLVVLPLRETGGFTVRRRLADFFIIPAAQGLVLKPRHEKVVARTVPDGVEITAEGGLKLSSSVDTGAALHPRERDGKAYKPLYDFEKWKGQAGETFTQVRQKLLRTVIEVKTDDKVLPRLDVARFYFAHGMGQEALSALSMIVKDLPEIESHPDFLAIRGGSRVLVSQFPEAITDLSHPSLVDQPEATLWRAAASAGMRDWVNAFDQFNSVWDLLSGYPEPFRSRFSILGIEAAVAIGRDDKISRWVLDFEKQGYNATYQPALVYLKGVTYSKAGRADMAEKMWRQVVRSPDRLYKVRSELALVDLGVATKSLTAKQAAERLEGLRFAWRGDDLELDILIRLGGFYMEAKEFRKGFEGLTQALRLFPNAPQTPMLRAELTRNFLDLFMTDKGKDLSPIDALSLFTDFKSLLPAGEEGNEARKTLAERLIDIDLLDPAAKLLKDVIKNSKDPAERVKTATRMAAVSLLDRKAEDALAYLDQSHAEASTLSDSIQAERQLLRVRALSETGKYTEALAALPQNNGKSVKLLRADIALRAKNWGDATKALLELVGPPDASKPMEEEKASWLVSAALAMAQGADLNGLDRLAVDYGAVMDKTSKANVFRILTRPEEMSQMKDLRGAQARLGEVDMFKDILDSYRKTPAP